MMMYTENVSRRLNELLSNNYLEEGFYKRAADTTGDPRLKRFLTTQAQNRYNFAISLRSEMRNMGETFSKKKNFTGDVRSCLYEISTTCVPNIEEVILDKVVKFQKSGLEEYRDLNNGIELPPIMQRIISTQTNCVSNALRSAKFFETVYS
jgi:uncharacterized protein (TIGR02284 family)